MSEYRTKIISVASFLCYCNAKLLSITRTAPNRFAFVFDDGEGRCERAEYDFYSGAMVDCQVFCEADRFLKQRLKEADHSQMGEWIARE
jgi:hypothetical protein